MKTLNKVFNYFFSKINTREKDIYLIDKEESINFLKETLLKEKIIALDTEFDWRNTYFPKLSLVQIATRNLIFLVDCLKCKNLKFLKSILEDEEKLIIFHSVRSDTTVLNTNLNIKIKNVFDIQVAEKNIGSSQTLSYASLVKKYFGIDLDKTETNSNWLKRPFTEKQLSYAVDDVSYLIEISELQKKFLKKKGNLISTFEQSKKEALLGNEELHKSRLRKLKKTKKINKNIFLWREFLARDKNIPPSHVMADSLMKLAAKNIINKKKLKSLFSDSSDYDHFIKYMNL